MKTERQRRIFILGLLVAIAAAAGILIGSVRVPVTELFNEANRPIVSLRLYRVCLAAIAGGGLAVLGVVLQAVLRNPLAEPYLLGTSSGAGVGAILAIIFGLSGALLPLAAFAGTLVSLTLVYLIARQRGRVSDESLILTGVIVAMASSGIIAFLVTVVSDRISNGMMWWLWGSLQVYDPKLLLAVGAAVAAGTATVYIFAPELNAISIGEEDATHLGVNAESVKKILFLLTSLITGAIVSACGVIGFVGLIVPHAVRLVVGPNHRVLIPASCLAGAFFMIVCDIISRTLFAPSEVPIGVITTIVGAPVFIMLLKRRYTAR